MAHLASFKLPAIDNEPNLHYEPNSKGRKALVAALEDMRKAGTVDVPVIINGKRIKTGKTADQYNPAEHATVVAKAHQADEKLVKEAIDGALKAKESWADMPWNDRAAIFLKAADLISGKYRAKICAATMLGQGKNAWQAEIDAAAELCDFLRFGVKYAEDLYAQQPVKNSPGVWNRVEYRPLEGFVLAVSPFNFTAIAGNLSCAPAMLGNVVVWKPSPMAILSAHLIYEILEEAGLPAGVIQFVPGDPQLICKTAFAHPDFASLHFTGSTAVFKQLWKDIAQSLDTLKNYPRIVGETGGKNFHLVHPSADVRLAVLESVRAGFEYQGQKCSALGRCYVPASLWLEFKQQLVEEVKKIKVGSPTEFGNFCGPVIARHSFDKIVGLVEQAKKDGGEIIAGGSWDESKGFFIQPTIIVTKDPRSVTMVNEIFGPVITVYVYKDAEWEETLSLIDTTTSYALTGAIFSRDRQALIHASSRLRNASGNVYFNTKCTGAVVGQQPFGGSRNSGTNDKAGSISLLYRFVSARAIKESFVDPTAVTYPSNEE